MNNNIGSIYTLKELRARKNKTQAQIARDLGISVQTYNAWEKDISNVGVSKVNALAKYYGVKLDQIFFGQIHEYNSCEINSTTTLSTA